MNKQFTASEVRSAIGALEARDMEYEAGMLHAYADRLEADEQAMPVAWCDPATIDCAHPTCYKKLEYISIADSVAGVKFVPLYAHPAPADAEKLKDAQDGWHYANGVADLAMKHRDAAEQHAERLAGALRKIVEWQPPSVTGRDGEQSSMLTEIGSIGVRDYFRRIAEEALAAHCAQTTPPAVDPARIQAGENALKVLANIRDAKRWDRKCFEDDRAFADWAQSWARHATRVDPGVIARALEEKSDDASD